MAVVAVRAESHHHLRADAAHQADDVRHGFVHVGPGQLAVDQVQKVYRMQVEYLSRVEQFCLADSAQAVRAGIFLRRAKPAFLAAGSGHQVGGDSFGGIAGQRAAQAHRFVVGVSQNGHQLERVGRTRVGARILRGHSF